MTKTAADWWAEAQAALAERDGNAILDCTEQVLELDADHEEAKALRFQVLMQVVEMLENAGNWERMHDVGQEIVERGLHPTLGDLIRAGALLELQRYDEGVAAAEAVIAADPSMTHARYLIGTCHLRQREYEVALPHFEAVLAQEADHGESLVNMGMCLDELGRHEHALALYDRALTTTPEHVFLHQNRGNTLASLGRLPEALASYEHALELQPEDFLIQRLRVGVLLRLARYDDAIEAALDASHVERSQLDAWLADRDAADAGALAEELYDCLLEGPHAIRERLGDGGGLSVDAAIDLLASRDAHQRESGLLGLDDHDLSQHPQVAEPLRAIANHAGELPALRAAAAHRLAFVDADAGVAILQGFITADDPGLRWRARNVLAQLLPDADVLLEMFRAGVDDPDPEARIHACPELARRDPEFDPLPPLAVILAEGESHQRVEALKALGCVPPSDAARELATSLLEDPDEAVQTFAKMTLMMLGGPSPF